MSPTGWMGKKILRPTLNHLSFDTGRQHVETNAHQVVGKLSEVSIRRNLTYRRRWRRIEFERVLLRSANG